MILFTLTILASPQSREQILEMLLSVKGPTEGKAGCLGSRLYQEILNENLITYEELWQNEWTLHNHIRSDLYRAILAAMDLSGKPPEVKFSHIAKTEDMDLIKRILGNGEIKEKEWGITRVQRSVR